MSELALNAKTDIRCQYQHSAYETDFRREDFNIYQLLLERGTHTTTTMLFGGNHPGLL